MKKGDDRRGVRPKLGIEFDFEPIVSNEVAVGTNDKPFKSPSPLDDNFWI